MRIIAITVSVIVAALLAALPVQASEEYQYKNFKMDNETTNAAIRYDTSPNGLDVTVSSVAMGKGSEFRKWEVTDIRLRIAGQAVRPVNYGVFYVTRESIFRYPAAVLFAAIGATTVSGSTLKGAITDVGAAIGLGLLAAQAKGEITGEHASFKLPADLASKIGPGDAIEITVEDKEMHWKDVIKTGLLAPSMLSQAPRTDYSAMSQAQVSGAIDTMKSEIESLETQQASYKYGEDPRYDDIQQKIEHLETERGLAYKVWYQRENKDRL
jgi:hypothetical protein